MDVDYVLLDLDGVIRHFDPERLAHLAQASGLAPQAVVAAINEPTRLMAFVKGEMTRNEWVDSIGDTLGNRTAASQILDDRGRVDPAMRGLLQLLNNKGFQPHILTNGSDTVEADLMHLGLLHLVGKVFNSWNLGVAKPSPRIYDLVADSIGASPDRVFFTDDAPANVEAAVERGWQATVFQSAPALQQELLALGVPAR